MHKNFSLLSGSCRLDYKVRCFDGFDVYCFLGGA